MACLVGLGAAGSGALAAEPAKPTLAGTSNERLRRPMAHAGGEAAHDARTTSPERLKERADLLKTGELALSRRQVDKALADFDRAAMILHAADTEMALVCSYMQGGEYRRALAFGAHTAGAHLDVADGAALYAWLLHSGGQGEVAQRLISLALGRSAGQPLVASVQQQLQSGQPRAAGALLNVPARLAPYGDARGLPANARVAGSGVLLGKRSINRVSCANGGNVIETTGDCCSAAGQCDTPRQKRLVVVCRLRAGQSGEQCAQVSVAIDAVRRAGLQQ